MHRLLVLLLAALLPACATVTSGTTQNISMITDPPGATCQLQRGGGIIGIINQTPGTANISRSSQAITVNCTRPGSLPAVQTIPAEFQAMTAGNILLGGVIGLAVDAASGAIARYPETVTLSLPPAQFATMDARDAWFAGRIAETRRLYAERIGQATSSCGGGAGSECAMRVSALETERDAAISMLEAQRLQARPG